MRQGDCDRQQNSSLLDEKKRKAADKVKKKGMKLQANPGFIQPGSCDHSLDVL